MEIELRTAYMGPLPVERAPGTRLGLAVEGVDQKGQADPLDALPMAQYRTLAISALERTLAGKSSSREGGALIYR